MRSKTLAQAVSAWRPCLMVAILVVLTAGTVLGSAITGIDVANKPDRVVIAVQGDCALSYVPIVSTAGKYVGFQFARSLAVKGRAVAIRSGGIYNIRYSSFRPRPPISRIVVNTTAHVSYTAQWSADKKRVEIHVMKSGIKPVKAAPNPPAAAPVTGPAPEQEETAAPAEPPAQPDERAQAPDPPADRHSAYAAIAKRSRRPRIAGPIPTMSEPPVAEPVAMSPAPAPVVPAVDPPKAQEPVSIPRPARTVSADRASAYAAIAEKTRKARVAAMPPSEAKLPPPVTASAPPSTELAAKPEVRVMGMTETSPSSTLSPSKDAVAPPEEPKPRGSIEVAAADITKLVLAPAKAAPATSGRKVSLNFLGADINDVLKALSVQTGQNIVASKDVTGTVTVSLSNVGLEEALDYVAKLSGYRYTKDNDTYLVAANDSLRTMSGASAPDSKTELVRLSYAKADDVITLLKARFSDVVINKVGVESVGKGGAESKGGQASVGTKSNLLVLVGPETSVAAAKALVQQFEDALRVQAMETSRDIYRVKYANPKQLAEALTTLVPGVEVVFAPSNDFDLVKFKSAAATSGQGLQVKRVFDNSGTGEGSGSQGSQSGSPKGQSSGGDQGGGKSDEVASQTNARTLVVIGDGKAVAKAMEVAAQLDVKAPQIKIDAKITSINASGEKKLGLKWNWGEFAAVEGFTDFDKLTDNADSPVNRQNVKVPHDRLFRQPWSVSAALDALVTSGDAKVLASPSIVCLNRNPGVFFVGDEVTYIQRIETTATGQNIVTDTKRVGVQMIAAGEVNDDGYVTLFLHPEVSTLKLSVEQGVTLPIVSSRSTDHVVRVKSGATIVIGGLIRDDEVEELNKVPFLGDLPVLGHLFRHKHKTTEHTEVVMFITATILQD